ncbi:MEKHLA domain-containing protein [Flavobacterium sp.]|uniref:MEKHLA domain-containing protein n=1 Tax=Flavobacterium sp. TaxID=239 RepID=UPI003D13B05D
MNSEEKYQLIKQIDDCFLALNGTRLPCPETVQDRYKWLHEKANYSILAVDNSTDSFFIYANQYALSCFKYTWDEILLIPSRFSAAAADREARALLFEKVSKNKIVYNYSGPRVDKYGNSFTINEAIVWELQDKDNNAWGQGALFWTIEEIQKRQSDNNLFENSKIWFTNFPL